MGAEIGKRFEIVMRVEREDLASAVGSGLQDVLSTPRLIAWMEKASVGCLALEDASLCSLGVKVDIEHIAATPLGCDVTVRSELASIEGRRYTFNVEAFDRFEKIGFGVHSRIVTNEARFMERANAKSAKSEAIKEEN